jgi:hypothetical protein
MREFLQSQPWREAADGPGGQEQTPAEPDLDLSFLDPGDPQFDPEQIAQRLSGLVDQVAQQRLEAGLAPLQEQMQDMRREREWQSIAEEFPELVDEQVAKPVFQLAKRRWLSTTDTPSSHRSRGSSAWPTSPARRWRANEEGAETPSAAHLEGGGGAAPAGSQVDALTQVFGAGEDQPLGRRALPFAG